MYIVLRFDDQVNAEVQETIINSVLLRELITHFYYAKDDGMLDVEQFNVDTNDAAMTYAFDQRYPIAHVCIDSEILKKDIMYVYLGSGSEHLTVINLVEGICTGADAPEDANDALRYAWERVQLDLFEMASNVQANPDRAMTGKIGDIQLLTAFWYGKSTALEQEMLQSFAAVNQEPGTTEETADECCQCDHCDCTAATTESTETV